MESKELDLSNFKNGVTLDVVFDIPGSAAPFLILVTSLGGEITYYKRYYNDKKVSINLPVLPDDGQILLLSQYPVKNILIGKIRKEKIPYKFDNRILQKRDYPFEAIQEKIVPYIPGYVNVNGVQMEIQSDQPARFHPSKGIAEYSEKIFSKLAQPVRVFIRKHEQGHYYYGRPIPPPHIMAMLPQSTQQYYAKQLQEDEEAADDYAIHGVLNDGYNFSGALYSLTEHLPDSYISQQRILRAFNKIDSLNRRYK